ncbi:nucleotidyltransferase [Alteromonadaceae bacterium BrNp21-10]|nr:nucleotidyltransferase [Alteromonadaceae bacterium BrNp21-10]
MSTTVTTAFNAFQKETVNLDAERTKNARNSRNWLVGKINTFTDFFPLYTAKHIHFGSFARRTKIRPLDDIDIMIALMGEGCSYFEDTSGKITINVPDDCDAYKYYKHAASNTLNSIRVVNEFVRKLSEIDQYKSATIKRNQEAAVLNLKSYDWAFDIVPCFFTTEDAYGQTYYIIPDGSGHWKKTDPRKDRDRVRTINSTCSGNMLNVLRLIKYWQRRPTMPSMGSYLLECMVLNHFESNGTCSQYQDLELAGVFEYIANHIYSNVSDPKGIQTNLNDKLTWEERSKISNKAIADANLALEARHLESNGDQKGSINKWRQIFGAEFPEYS